MDSQKVRKAASRRRRPGLLEPLEPRPLLSVIPIIERLGPNWGHAHSPGGGTAASSSTAGGIGALSTLGQPTPHELARERFVAKLAGTYVAGPGRFTDESLQAFFLGSGGSNQSLHMTLQMRVFVPTDASRPITGIAELFAKDVANSGNTLVLDLTATSPPGPQGLPSQFTWTVDPSSAGIWQNAGGFGTGQGTLQVHFSGRAKLPHRATGAGQATFVFQGLINTSQVSNDLASPGNRPTGT